MQDSQKHGERAELEKQNQQYEQKSHRHPSAAKTQTIYWASLVVPN